MARTHAVAREEEPELRIARSDGNYVFDTRGKKYIDFLMGWCVGNFGWGNAVIRKPARAFEGPDYVYPNFDYPPWDELADLLLAMAPGRLATCFRATGGSEAVDLALQAAMVHTGRRKFLSLEDSYHGNTIAALSVGASEYREKRRGLLPGCRKVKPPLTGKSLGAVERALTGKEIAAFILEPISMNLGVRVPADGVLAEIQRLCRKHGTLLIADEVATGFGRTGTLFATEQVGIEPDMITLAKAVTDGVGGLGAMLASAKVARSMEKDGAFYSTYGWHPRSVEAAIATLRYINRNERRLFAGMAKVSEYFRTRLEAMAFKREAEVRVRGLAIGLGFGDRKYPAKVAARCRARGLLVSPEDDTLLLIPALNVDLDTARKGLDILGDCA
jgi:acetylornithine/succinyldiaminopimelate/putrescine aminotransferase